MQAEQYDVDEMATLVDEQRAIFNPDQAAAFDAILESVTNNQGHLFWDQFKAGLCDDVKHKLHHINHYQAD